MITEEFLLLFVLVALAVSNILAHRSLFKLKRTLNGDRRCQGLTNINCNKNHAAIQIEQRILRELAKKLGYVVLDTSGSHFPSEFVVKIQEEEKQKK